MPLVYIVDDEVNIRQLVSIGLKDAGFDTREFSDGITFLHALNIKQPDAVVLDWMMSPLDGLYVCQSIRENPATRHIPVIMLTARSNEADRISGLELGADDYLTKPFSVKELAARVKATLRRNEYLSTKNELIQIGDLTLDAVRRKVMKKNIQIDLSLKEFELLYELMRHPGRVFTRDILLDHIWKTNFYGDTRTVDVHIRYLRQKIEDVPDNPKYILTVRGVGYCFTDKEEIV